jgi:hypothetical protein
MPVIKAACLMRIMLLYMPADHGTVGLPVSVRQKDNPIDIQNLETIQRS